MVRKFQDTEIKDVFSRSVVSNSLRPHGLHSLWNSPGQNTGVGSRSLLQGIFLTQVSNPGLPHCRRILYQLSHQGIPEIAGCSTIQSSSNSNYLELVEILHIKGSVPQGCPSTDVSYKPQMSSSHSHFFLADYRFWRLPWWLRW